MSFDLQSAVAELQFNNYMAVVISTAVVYDYIITFPKEIKYIWNRPWTFVSWMFVIVRYLGILLAMIDAFYETPFIPGPILACTVLLLLRVWAFIIFLAATEIVMILRVYAMYNRSKVIFGVLLVPYVATVLIYAVSGGYYNNPDTYLTMTVIQVLNTSFCSPVYNIQNHYLGTYKLIPRLILSGLMLISALSRFVMECYQSYRATKQWRTNQYVKLLTREGILYFLGHLLYVINFGETVPGTIITTLSIIVMYILSPRFIISVRDLYLRKLYDQDKGIDIGFGASNWPGSSLSMVFEDGMSASIEGDIEMWGEEVASTRDIVGESPHEA